MPVFGQLFFGFMSLFYRFMVKVVGAEWGLRLTAATTLAGLYVACAITFSIMIVPWLAAFAATQFGLLLGLLFPPVAGTVVASLGTFWACVLAKRYSVKLIKATVGH